MPNKDNPKRHHIVPKLLIRNFFIPGQNKTAVMFKNNGFVRPTSETEIAVEGEYNSSLLDNNSIIKERNKKTNDLFVKTIAKIERFSQGKTLEKKLGDIESDVAPIISNIISTNSLSRTSDEKKCLILFKNTLEARNRSLKTYINNHLPSPIESNRDLLDVTFALVMNKLINLHHQNKHDHIQISLCKAEGRNFCLSDNPVLSRYSLDAHIGFPFNHLLPISPNLALMFNDKGELGNETQFKRKILDNNNIIVEKLMVHKLNLIQIHRAYYHICFSSIEYAESYLFALEN